MLASALGVSVPFVVGPNPTGVVPVVVAPILTGVLTPAVYLGLRRITA